MKDHIKKAAGFIIFFTILCGFIYPLAITGIGNLLFPCKSNGSIITVHGKNAGSELIGQTFTCDRYFHGRPSATNNSSMPSSGSNYGPTSANLKTIVDSLTKEIRTINDLKENDYIPPDAVFSSASGIDPHISPQYAFLQIQRIAKARNIKEETIRQLVENNTENSVFSPQVVNVLKLNIALDNIK